METRLAQPPDLEAIMEIYHDEVLQGTGTFDTEPLSQEKQKAWFESHDRARYPLIVALGEGRVLGWGSIKAWSDRRAYDRTAEISVYVHREHRRRNVGRVVLAELVARARNAGLGVLLARIAGGNEGSTRMFRGAGFKPIGTMRRVGEKHGQVLDVELMDLQIEE